MGFLVKIKYHPKKEGGAFGYDTENFQEKTLKIGNKDEEIDYSVLAVALIKQLSRRDILVTDMDTIEFVKKPLKIRESSDGIVIGNKKYKFNNVNDPSEFNITTEEEIETKNKPIPGKKNVPAKRQFNVIKREYLSPNDNIRAKNIASDINKLKLTIGKAYDIIKESGDYYTLINDSGNPVRFPMFDFSATKPGSDLQYNNEMNKKSDEIPLSYGNNNDFGVAMPELRGRTR
jgi:hypothetical protein